MNSTKLMNGDQTAAVHGSESSHCHANIEFFLVWVVTKGVYKRSCV